MSGAHKDQRNKGHDCSLLVLHALDGKYGVKVSPDDCDVASNLEKVQSFPHCHGLCYPCLAYNEGKYRLPWKGGGQIEQKPAFDVVFRDM